MSGEDGWRGSSPVGPPVLAADEPVFCGGHACIPRIVRRPCGPKASTPPNATSIPLGGIRVGRARASGSASDHNHVSDASEKTEEDAPHQEVTTGYAKRHTDELDHDVEN